MLFGGVWKLSVAEPLAGEWGLGVWCCGVAVMLLRGADGEAFDQPQILDMQKLPESDVGSDVVSIAKGHEHGAFGIDPFNYFS